MHKFYAGGGVGGDGAVGSWQSSPRQEKWSDFIGSALGTATPRAGAAFQGRRGLPGGSLDVDPLLLARLRRSRPFVPFSDLTNIGSKGSGTGIYPFEGRSSVSSFTLKPPEAVYKTPMTVAAMENRMELLDGVLVSDSAAPNWGRSSAGGFSPSARSAAATDSASAHKTAICRWWAKGACRHGHKCKQAHGEDELRRPPQDREHARGEDDLLRSAQVHELPITGSYRSSFGVGSPSSPISAVAAASPYGEGTRNVVMELKTEATKNVVMEVKTEHYSCHSLDYLNPPESLELLLGQWPLSPADDEYATALLYGTRAQQRRLPVFEMICSQC